MNASSFLSIVVCLSLLILSGCSSDTPASNPSSLIQPTASIIQSINASDSSQIVQANVYSTALDREMDLSIYLPPGYSPDTHYPVLYLLYGYGGTPDSWFSYLKINQVADRLLQENKIDPLIIVAPDYRNSFGVNSKVGEGKDPGSVDIGSYEDYLVQDVISYVDGHYSTQASKEGRYIGGISMGGYAALFLGFSHTELFSKVGAHSAAIWNYTPSDMYTDQRDWLYANETLRQARDPFKLAEHKKLDATQVYLDAGNSDGLAEKDYDLYELLRAKNIDAQWVPNPGGHDSAYWSGQMENYFLFYAGKQPTTSQSSPQEIWKVQTGGRITSSPLLVEGNIYFGSDDHKLYAVDSETGQVAWSFTADSQIRSSPKSNGSSILFQSHKGTLYKLNASSGVQEWTVAFDAPVPQAEQDEWDYYDSSASMDEEVLYVGRADSRLYALNTATGKQLWSYEAAGPIKSSPIYDDASVYFGDWEGYLYAVDKKTGNLLWSYHTEPNNHHKSIQSTPVIHKDVIYWGCRNFELYALDVKTGKPLWEQSAPAWVASPIYQNDTLYVGNSNGDFMSAVDPKTGKEIWRFDTSSNVLSAPAFENGLLIFGSGYAYSNMEKEEYLYAVDASSGQLVWKLATDKIQSTPVVANGVVYYTGFDGALHAILLSLS
ncbi:PQQ-binding-like beta-propeller repeat protein [Cohnella sp. WQ 127256]|uniref:outer membrane protein assembly factor BamB family protein n=1 Tax=Cohnella sp. WQ 127256 TaxID=2938790 RepID=UPI00211781D2|nr:PQQ-binding-like beta-propeller repeat protein [Cohnella sp. WQ 127256]